MELEIVSYAPLRLYDVYTTVRLRNRISVIGKYIIDKKEVPFP
ncbi:hypothetical protein KL86DYS2_10435 [uncultured Dysgonomonas sp.]|uniref:Uncharacterized protein n=1 Tax=uncultured Dysgonomonas sp. TaxID=206096 RepID=A0A212J094_9BACT|nr:hypothetical protein KL86DYS2_10435 [uncultured Dysgonomonas sp.]